jgi:hypothetical protein
MDGMSEEKYLEIRFELFNKISALNKAIIHAAHVMVATISGQKMFLEYEAREKKDKLKEFADNFRLERARTIEIPMEKEKLSRLMVLSKLSSFIKEIYDSMYFGLLVPVLKMGKLYNYSLKVENFAIDHNSTTFLDIFKENIKKNNFYYGRIDRYDEDIVELSRQSYGIVPDISGEGGISEYKEKLRLLSQEQSDNQGENFILEEECAEGTVYFYPVDTLTEIERVVLGEIEDAIDDLDKKIAKDGTLSEEFKKYNVLKEIKKDFRANGFSSRKSKMGGCMVS